MYAFLPTYILYREDASIENVRPVLKCTHNTKMYGNIAKESLLENVVRNIKQNVRSIEKMYEGAVLPWNPPVRGLSKTQRTARTTQLEGHEGRSPGLLELGRNGASKRVGKGTCKSKKRYHYRESSLWQLFLGQDMESQHSMSGLLETCEASAEWPHHPRGLVPIYERDELRRFSREQLLQYSLAVNKADTVFAPRNEEVAAMLPRNLPSDIRALVQAELKLRRQVGILSLQELQTLSEADLTKLLGLVSDPLDLFDEATGHKVLVGVRGRFRERLERCLRLNSSPVLEDYSYKELFVLPMGEVQALQARMNAGPNSFRRAAHSCVVWTQNDFSRLRTRVKKALTLTDAYDRHLFLLGMRKPRDKQKRREWARKRKAVAKERREDKMHLRKQND